MTRKSKIKYYKNLAWKIIFIKSNFELFIFLKNKKVATRFRKSVKNQLFCLEKTFKKTIINLGITNKSLLK